MFAFQVGFNWTKSLPICSHRYKRILQHLGGPLNLVGTEHPATFSNANLYRLLLLNLSNKDEPVAVLAGHKRESEVWHCFEYISIKQIRVHVW